MNLEKIVPKTKQIVLNNAAIVPDGRKIAAIEKAMLYVFDMRAARST